MAMHSRFSVSGLRLAIGVRRNGLGLGRIQSCKPIYSCTESRFRRNIKEYDVILFSAPSKILIVGEELTGETLQLKSDERLYKLVGLREKSWYEVKISYPASIPASFSIELRKDLTDLHRNNNRRLLNTEKLIFKAVSSEQVHILVTVNAEGVVAQPNVQARELVLFNIVCDVLVLGIPRFTWWVGLTAILCLVFAFVFPHFFPLHRLFDCNSEIQKGK